MTVAHCLKPSHFDFVFKISSLSFCSTSLKSDWLSLQRLFERSVCLSLVCVVLEGEEIEKEHCVLDFTKGKGVSLDPISSLCWVNGVAVSQATQLNQGMVSDNSTNAVNQSELPWSKNIRSLPSAGKEATGVERGKTCNQCQYKCKKTRVNRGAIAFAFAHFWLVGKACFFWLIRGGCVCYAKFFNWPYWAHQTKTDKH